MSMSLSPTRLFVCTACGAVLPVPKEHVGKQCRCGRCGKISLVVEAASDWSANQPASSDAEQQIRFACRVCAAPLVARGKHTGRKAKCPNCRALTSVPPSSSSHSAQISRADQVPGATQDQQYGVWGVDDAPSAKELAASQGESFPVYCRVCDTLMRAPLEQVGQSLVCPDCGAATVFKAPPKPVPKKSALVPDGDEYQLDVTQAPVTRPQRQFEPPTPTTARPASEPTRTESDQRPQMPPVPVLQGVMAMLVRSPVLPWFLMLSAFGLTVSGFMMLVVRIHPIAAIPFFVAAGMGAIVGLLGLSAICLAVLTESSEGNDRLYNPPGPVFLDWMGEVFYLLTAGTLALAPWWLLCRLVQQDVSLEVQGLLMLAGWLFTFPLLLLSCLENGSPLELYSARVYGSVVKRPWHWAMFLVESMLLAAGTVFVLVGLLATRSAVALLSIPLGVAALLLYFRLLGRFAWWLAETLATKTETQNETADAARDRCS